MRTVVSFLVLTLAAGCPLPGTNCNDLYAPSGVFVELLADDWAPGLWEVQIEGKGCMFTLPGAEDLDCDTVVWADFDPDETRLEAIFLTEQTPESVEIVLVRDGVEVDRATLEPVYEDDEPNGKGCGIRQRADEELEVDVST